MNAFKETNKRNDDVLQKKWTGVPKHTGERGDIDFTGDPGLTDPSHAADADINNIVNRYHKTGVFPEAGEQLFADVSDAPTYQQALQTVIDAENAFMALDARTRKRFDNDAMQMLAFLDDPQNRAEAVALGMINEQAPTPQPAAPEVSAPKPEASRAKAKPRSEDTDG